MALPHTGISRKQTVSAQTTAAAHETSAYALWRYPGSSMGTVNALGTQPHRFRRVRPPRAASSWQVGAAPEPTLLTSAACLPHEHEADAAKRAPRHNPQPRGGLRTQPRLAEPTSSRGCPANGTYRRPRTQGARQPSRR